ncbi:unannotated protein [freshwater metagenome]|jgi:hypothetical protein|uniref:Unannotated protein n=1 Tax=freshwater metagenome TaxID=449393 RepID=A0A6J7I8G0_9ZZZZ|nr:hypothetical protein [Actinomycetota bacterium]
MKRIVDRFSALPRSVAIAAGVLLLAALGGTSYALVTIPKESVGPGELKLDAVTRPRIRDGAVTGPKIRNGTIELVMASSDGTFQVLDIAAATGPTRPEIPSMIVTVTRVG